MKWILRVFIIVLFFFQIPLVWAEDCSQDEIQRLKALAETIQMDSEFAYDDVVLGIYGNNIVTVQGLTDELYIISKDQSTGFFPEEIYDGKIVKYVHSGLKTFEVYPNKCYSDTVLRTINLDLKRYNQYANYEECDGIDGNELDVCDEFYEGNITYNQFINKVNKYKEKKSFISEEKVDDFVDDYIIYIVIGGVLLILIIIGFIIRNRRRSKLD